MIAEQPDIFSAARPSVAPLLQATFAALQGANIRYILMRGFDELADLPDGGDVDLLIDAAQLAPTVALLARLSYVRLERWGYAPHHFFIGYDQARDRWVKLDIVTAVAYGHPIPALQTQLAEACLAHRIHNGECFVLAPADELLTLLLHCLLDKAAIRPGYQARLQELAQLAEDDDYLARQAAELFGAAPRWAELRQMIEDGRWDALLKTRHGLVKRLSDGRYRWRSQSARGARIVDRRTRGLRNPGLGVALLAPDGAGKTTLAHALGDSFYLPARYVYMGTNRASSTINLPTSRWLEGRNPGLPGPLWRGLRSANALLEQVVRYRYAASQRRKGRLVVFDRYPTNSLVHRRGGGLPKRVQHWLMRRLIPAPDLTVLLDAPAEVLYSRKQDHPVAVLDEQRQGYLRMVQQIRHAVVVRADQAPDEVRRAVVGEIWRRYAALRADS